MENIIKYMEQGINIVGNPEIGYTIFTVKTQHFHIKNLEDLTPELFEEKIKLLKERELFDYNLLELYHNSI